MLPTRQAEEAAQLDNIAAVSQTLTHLSSDYSWAEALVLAELIKNPCHDALISADIWCRDVGPGP